MPAFSRAPRPRVLLALLSPRDVSLARARQGYRLIAFLTVPLRLSSTSFASLLLPQLAAQRLAHLGLGQHVPELDVLGHLVGGQRSLRQRISSAAWTPATSPRAATNDLMRSPASGSGPPTVQAILGAAKGSRSRRVRRKILAPSCKRFTKGWKKFLRPPFAGSPSSSRSSFGFGAAAEASKKRRAVQPMMGARHAPKQSARCSAGRR